MIGVGCFVVIVAGIIATIVYFDRHADGADGADES